VIHAVGTVAGDLDVEHGVVTHDLDSLDAQAHRSQLPGERLHLRQSYPCLSLY